MPGAGSNRINEFGFYTNYYTLPFIFYSSSLFTLIHNKKYTSVLLI